MPYIDGLIKAEHSIHHVHSGGQVTAAVLAPWIGSITANDAAMASLFPAPTPPESVAQDILDEAAAVHAEVLAAKAEVADDILTLLAEFQAAKKAEAGAIAQEKAAVEASNAEIAADAAEANETAKEEAQGEFAARRAAAASELAGFQKRVAASQAAIKAERDSVKASLDEKYAAVAAKADAASKELADESSIDTLRDAALKDSNTERMERRNRWDELVRRVVYGNEDPNEPSFGEMFCDNMHATFAENSLEVLVTYFVKCPVNLAGNIISMVFHPIQTIIGICHAASHPAETWEAMKKDFWEKMETPAGQAEFIGDFAWGWFLGHAGGKLGDTVGDMQRWGNRTRRAIDDIPKPRCIDDAADWGSVSHNARTRVPTGQVHHPISTKIARELEDHPTLRGHYKPRDPRFTTQAIDDAAHRGYQRWHRDLDDEVIEWLRRPENRNATPEQFEQWLRWRYTQPDLLDTFPNGF